MANKTIAPEPAGFDSSKLYIWVKSLESKINNLMRETELLKSNLIKKNEELKAEAKTMNSELMEIKSQHQKMVEQMDLLIKEIKQTAGIEEVMVLKKYIDLWNPMHFVTQRDLERAIESRLVLLKENARNEHAGSENEYSMSKNAKNENTKVKNAKNEEQQKKTIIK